jgi:hypothetical protein
MLMRRMQRRLVPLSLAPLLLALALALAGCSSAEASTSAELTKAIAPKIVRDEAREIAHARRVPARVLHAGDSTVGGGLSHALWRRFQAEGAHFSLYHKRSVGIKAFAQTPDFRDAIANGDPDLVILTLGSNDVFAPHPRSLAKYVEEIAAVASAGARECWWIGPPTWRGDSGVVSVIREHSGACTFFDSSDMKDVARTRDGIHPNERGGARWALKFWRAYDGRAPSDEDARVMLDVARWR